MKWEVIRTEAAARIVDIWMGNNQEWRNRLEDSDFLESADWLRALEETDAVFGAYKELIDDPNG